MTPGLTAVAAGYEPFGDACPSDHRALWADFTYEDAFGYSPPPLIAPEARRLRTEDPRVTARYNSRVKTALEKEHLPEQLFKLENDAKINGWSIEYQEKYNDIQRRQLKIRKDIELHIRKIKTGEVPWSPKLQRFRTEIELWTMILRKRKGVKVSNKRIRRFMRKTGIWNALKYDLEDATKKLCEIHEAYTEAKKVSRRMEKRFS